MFYECEVPRSFNGEGDYLDLSNHLHRFLRSTAFSADIGFCTDDPGYQALLAIYFKESLMPNFSLNLNKGRLALTVQRGGCMKILASERAYCDGQSHTLSFRGTPEGVRAWVDGDLVIKDDAPGLWCEFGYMMFATAGRGALEDQYADYFHGELLFLRLSDSEEPLPETRPRPCLPTIPLFKKGMLGCENFRIPTIVTTKYGVTVASVDARMETPGDNPNHICRAIRISRDSGETWEEPRILFDFGGVGREDGAAAIDGSLLCDEETDTLFMLYSHTSAGIGSVRSVAGVGFDAKGRKRLWDPQGREFYREADGRIVGEDGGDTGCRADVYGRLFREDRQCGSVCHGAERIFRQADTSFLQIISSTDGGETWSEPRELNPQVKEEWMKFIGAGPGTGIQLREGVYRGRLVYPVYFSSESARAYSNGAIYSDDHGATWKRGASVNDGRLFEGKPITARDADDPRANLGECQIVELPDGRLRMFIRNPLGCRTGTAVSLDGGESWRDFELQEALPDPECQSHVLRIHHEGRDAYLFSNPAHESCRVRGTVRYSTDGAQTWTASRLVEPGEFGYSCMTQLPDGQIGILYEGADVTQQFAKFPVEWLLSDGE